VQRKSPEAVSNIFGTGPAEQDLGEGYVDQSGLIRALPESLQKGAEGLSDESAARQALEDGEIQAFYLVPAITWIPARLSISA